MRPAARSLLAIPPFPGARAPVFARHGEVDEIAGRAGGGEETADLLAALAAHRVGGCYWGRQPVMPQGRVLLDGTAQPAMVSMAWPADADPWHLLERAGTVRLPAGDARILLALAAGRPVAVAGDEAAPDAEMVAALVAAHLTGWQWHDPFSGARISVREAIALCGFWRRLIDGNRPIVAAMGFAHWKRTTVAPLLWPGHALPFPARLPRLVSGEQVAIWRTRLSAAQARDIERQGPPVLEVEDGFIRSTGLGADCVPPLSIIVDGVGVHFDPMRPSGLEALLQHGEVPPALRARAASLRAAIVAGGLSKYERAGAAALPRPGGARRHVLVPGQVEDDRAVTSGGALPSNLELLKRARAEVGPEAYLIYKPHPDVLAGHRRGLVASADMAALADRVETTAPMAALIDMVDEVQVNSSLAGFEALLRGKPVTVHGVPFYAGWGLTRDLGPVPARRTARRSLDELVAAALLLYPRYLDPQTGLPCPAEVLVARLAGPGAPRPEGAGALVVAARRLQGRVRAGIARLQVR